MRCLGKLCDVSPGKTPAKASYTSAGDIKIVKFRDVLEDGTVDYANDEDGWFDSKYADSSDLVDLLPGTILLTNAAHSVEHIGKKVAYVDSIPNMADRVCFVGELTGIRSKTDLSSTKWLFYWLQTDEAKRAIIRAVEGAHLIPREFKKILIPDVLEREKVTHLSLLSKIDDAIAKAKAELDAAWKSKKSFANKTLEKGFCSDDSAVIVSKFWVYPKTWELVCLKRLLKNMDSGSSPMCESEPAKPGRWGVLKVSAVSWDRFEELENKALPETIDPDIKEEVLMGDIIASRANTTELCGAVQRVKSLYARLLLCDKTWRLHPNDDVNPDWLVAILKHPQTRKQIEANATGTSDSMKNIAKRDFRNIVVPKPPRNVQDQIADTLNAFDAYIESSVSKIKALQEVKKSLLQNLLTGKIRIPEGVLNV